MVLSRRCSSTQPQTSKIDPVTREQPVTPSSNLSTRQNGAKKKGQNCGMPTIRQTADVGLRCLVGEPTRVRLKLKHAANGRTYTQQPWKWSKKNKKWWKIISYFQEGHDTRATRSAKSLFAILFLQQCTIMPLPPSAATAPPILGFLRRRQPAKRGFPRLISALRNWWYCDSFLIMPNSSRPISL